MTLLKNINIYTRLNKELNVMLTTSAMNRLEAFEMWTYQRILEIPRSYNEHRSITREKELLHTVKIRKT